MIGNMNNIWKSDPKLRSKGKKTKNYNKTQLAALVVWKISHKLAKHQPQQNLRLVPLHDIQPGPFCMEKSGRRCK